MQSADLSPANLSIPSASVGAWSYERVMLLLLLAFASANVVTGPLRWALALVKLSPLVYLPTMGLLLGVGWTLLRSWSGTGPTRLHLVTLLVIGYGVLIGLLFNPLVQAGFGVYVLLPFFFGLAVAPVFFAQPERLVKAAWILWLIACTGVILNYITLFPWEGFEYEVAGQTIEGSREWQSTGGGRRIAGFSRASFDAAIQVQLLAILLVMLRKGFWSNLFIWIVSAVAISFTTSKGIYNVYLVLTPIVLFKDWVSERLCRFGPLFFGFVGLYLPLSTRIMEYNFYINDPFWANITFSFYDRLNRMWPEAFELMTKHGNWLVGRGYGGIGTAQTYFEPERFNAGDNLFMYWMVIYGWFGLIIFIPLVLATPWLKPWTRRTDALPYVFTMATLIYGMTTNVVENAFFALVCGMCVSYLAVRFREVLTYGK